jgi:uncharacterized protein with PIN domain
MDDLIQILEEKYLPVEIIEILNTIDRQDIEDYAIEHNICPRCLSQLNFKTFKDYRNEYMGFPAYEDVTEVYCQCCGAVY